MPFDHRAKYAWLVACITLLVSSLGFRFAVQALNIYLKKEPVPMRGTFASIPRVLGHWTAVGDDGTYDKAIIETLGTSNAINRAYACDQTIEPSSHQAGEENSRSIPPSLDASMPAMLSVHLAYYTGMIDAVPHIPKRCFIAAGMEQQSQDEVVALSVDDSVWKPDPGPPNHATGEPYRVVELKNSFTSQTQTVRMPLGPLQIRVMEFAEKDHPDLRIFGGYFFIANGRVTPTPEDIRMLAFKPSERSAYYCKVQFMYAAPIAGGRAASRERYVELVSDLLRDLLPELMLRLPDWHDIENSRGQNVKMSKD